MSRLAKGTRLTPVFTLVFYTGEDEWDGPMSLHDMLAMDDRLKPFVSDYSLNLVDVGHPSVKLPFRTKALQELFYLLPSIYNGSCITDNTEISGAVVSLAGILAGSENLYRIGKEGDAVVCRTLEELEKRGEQKGELRLNTLVQMLLRDGRMEELHRSVQDAGLRRQLYEEYHL